MCQNDWHIDTPQIPFRAIDWLSLLAHRLLEKWQRNMREDSLVEGKTREEGVDITIIRGN